MQCTFEHLSGSKTGQLEQLEGERITVGRDPANSLSFDPMKDLDVSSHHAQLAVGDEGKYMLTDLGSRNGTFLNGTKVAGTVLAEPGSKIQFGKGGPEVRIAYTPGAKKPGATRVMLAQVQQNLEEEKAKAAQSKKKTLIVVAIVGVLALGAGGGYMAYSSHAAKKQKATDAQTACIEQADKAGKSKAEAMPEYAAAKELDAAGDEAFKKGDYALAMAKWDEARRQYGDAVSHKLTEDAAGITKRFEEEMAKRDAERQQREQELQAQMARQQEEMQANAAKAVADLEAQMKKATAAERAKMEAELAKLKVNSPEVAKEIATKSETSLAYILVESYIAATKDAPKTVIAKAEGTGFVIAGDMIATSKHVLEPHKYDAQLQAKAKKYKEEHKIEVQTSVEVYMAPSAGQPFVKKWDTVGNTCKILKVGVDHPGPSQAVQIEFNMQTTSVPGIQVNERNIDDFAILQIPAGGLKPCEAATAGVEKANYVIVLGTVRESAGKRLITASTARAEISTKTDTIFSVNATVPGTFSGCPIFKYDGKIYGIVAGTEGANLICLPIDKVLALKGK